MAYRFGQTAAAIGVTGAALRNWMSRNEVDLWGERPEGGWRSFSDRDVYVLALAAELVNYGAKVDEAVNAVQGAIANAPGGDPLGLPSYLYAARSRFGGWEMHADEGLALTLANHRSVIKLAPTVIMAEANARLRGDNRDATE